MVRRTARDDGHSWWVSIGSGLDMVGDEAIGLVFDRSTPWTTRLVL